MLALDLKETGRIRIVFYVGRIMGGAFRACLYMFQASSVHQIVGSQKFNGVPSYPSYMLTRSCVLALLTIFLSFFLFIIFLLLAGAASL